MIRRPPRSTQSRSSAASDVYKRQFAFRKPTYVLPVPGHAEQFINARLADDLGLGFQVTEENLLPRLMEMHDKDSWMGRKPMPPKFEINGDEEAAEGILELAAKRGAK